MSSSRPEPAAGPAFHGPFTPAGGLAVVVAATVTALAAGFNSAPLWDEDETRFAAVALEMLQSGDWIVPRFNGELAVDKPVLMHWAMAASAGLLGLSEFAVRLPSAIATLAAALAIYWAGRRWFDPLVGIVAALAYVGCLLVGIESHAATPDAILVALVTWATVLAADGLLSVRAVPDRGLRSGGNGLSPGRLSAGRAALVGGLTGLAVLCKGPVGFVGPLAVVWIWAAWLVFEESCRAAPAPKDIGGWAMVVLARAVPCGWRALVGLRPWIVTLSMLAVAAPWYGTVSLWTDGAWPEGFFLVHNVGRFAAPMEKHAGGILYHPLALLAGFFPWSCFLPLAVVVAAWRSFGGHRRSADGADVAPAARAAPGVRRAATILALAWLGIWVATFSAAATKLPNYVLPAYPAAALIVAGVAVEEVRRRVPSHPRWTAIGVGSLAAGGIATAAAVLVATRFGLEEGAPAAAVGIVPVVGALGMLAVGARDRGHGLAVLAATGLLFTALAAGPAAGRLARANTLPGLVRAARADAVAAGVGFELATLDLNVPGIVFYAGGRVKQCGRADPCLDWLAARPDARLLVREDRYEAVAERLPRGHVVIGRTRPLFRHEDVLLVAMPERSIESSAAVEAAAADRSDVPGSVIR
jgi:4-amino-4-deoxy-L-arabinose transferase-like glycosyltransferase